MKVRQFLNAYNIGRSTASVTVINVKNTKQVISFSKYDIEKSVYGPCGEAKLNSFDVANNELIIYAEF